MDSEANWQLISDPKALGAIEPEWWTLWRRAPSATPFQSPAWLLPWWHAFAPGQIFTIAVRLNGSIIALALFYRERRKADRMLPLGASISDYHDVLIDPDCAETAREALASAMARCAPDWRVWELAELRDDAQALRLPAPRGCETSNSRASLCTVLHLPHQVEHLPRALPIRQRRVVRMARNRIGRRGQSEVVSADAATAPEILETLLRLHALRWAMRGEPGVMADARVQTFHRQALLGLLAAGFLRLYELRIAGKTVAVYYGFVHRKRAYAYLMGFDPDYAFESPGVALLAHAMEEAIREGACEFHFLRGDEAYKYKWGVENRWNERRIFTRLDPYARAS